MHRRDGRDAKLASLPEVTFVTALVRSESMTGFHSKVATADFNRDGLMDVAVANYADDTVSILLQIPGYRASIEAPINSDGSSIFKANRGVIPVKFSLTNNSTPTCELPPANISVTRIAGAVVGSIDEGSYSLPADKGANFRVDLGACEYVYNLAASPLGVGTYRTDISIGGTVVGHGMFVVK